MASLGAAIPYLILAAVALAFLWGSIVALRGRRWWATVMMTTGSSMQVVGALVTCVGTIWMMTRMTSMISSSGGSASAMSSLMSVTMVLVVGGLIVMGLGFLFFAAGFLGFCGRYGAAERRAKELEEVVEGLRLRMDQ